MDDPPSLRGQIGATRDAVKRLVGAHVELAKAEIGEVLDEVKKVAALVGIAVAAAISAALLLAVGMPLFLGELLFGSIGWGILHGLLLLAAIGVAAVVGAFGVSAAVLGRSLLVGVVSGVAVAVLLGLNLTHRAWVAAGDALLPLADGGSRPLVAAIVVLPVAMAVLVGIAAAIGSTRGGSGAGGERPPVGSRIAAGLPTAIYVGWLAAFIYSYSSRVAWPDFAIAGVGLAGFAVALVVLVVIASWRPGLALVGGMSIGVVLGLVLGGLTAIEFGRRVAAAIGVTVGLATWIATMGAEVAREGVDTEELKKRFIPQKTMDITKETIEWARARMPLSRRS